MNKKNGAPIKAVNTPIGSSAGERINLAPRSATTRNAPPTNAITGIFSFETR
jgi:hypothetical protein